MGLGEALMEEQEFRRLPKKLSHALVHKFPSMLEYKSPTSLDMPEVETVLVEDPDPRGPFGAKEAGQGPLLPIMPAVANAVYDAVGVRVDESPVTPEKIVKALAEKKAGRVPRYGPDRFPAVNFGFTLSVPPPWEGGDGYALKDIRSARNRTEGVKNQTGHDTAAAVSVSLSTHHRGGGAYFGRRSRQCDAARRRHRLASEDEAAAAGTGRAGQPPECGGPA